MQGKNTSDIKLNVPRSRKMSRSRPINVSVSVSSRTQNWTSRSRSRSRESGRVSVSVSSRTGSETSRSRLGLGLQRLVYIPADDTYHTVYIQESRAVAEKPHDAVVKFDTCRNLQRHRVLLLAIARLSCISASELSFVLIIPPNWVRSCPSWWIVHCSLPLPRNWVSVWTAFILVLSLVAYYWHRLRSVETSAWFLSTLATSSAKRMLYVSLILTPSYWHSTSRKHSTLFVIIPSLKSLLVLQSQITSTTGSLNFLKDIHTVQNMGTTFPPLVKYLQALFRALPLGRHLM